jgi:hypothetical protein
MSKLEFFQTQHPKWWTLEEVYEWFSACDDPEPRRAYGRASASRGTRSFQINQFASEAERALLNGDLRAHASINGGPIQLLHEWEWTRLTLLSGEELQVSSKQSADKAGDAKSPKSRDTIVSCFVIEGVGVKRTWRQRSLDRKREMVETRRGPKRTIGALIESALENFEYKGMNVAASPWNFARTDVARELINFLNKNYPAPAKPYKVGNVLARLNAHWAKMKNEAAEVDAASKAFANDISNST